MKTIFINGLSGKMGKTINNLILDDADFKIVKTTIILEKKYHELYESKKINHEQLSDIISKFNNVKKIFFIL